MPIFYSIGGKILTRVNRSFLKKTCTSSTTLSTTEPTGLTWYRNRISVGERLASNRLSHKRFGTISSCLLLILLLIKCWHTDTGRYPHPYNRTL